MSNKQYLRICFRQSLIATNNHCFYIEASKLGGGGGEAILFFFYSNLLLQILLFSVHIPFLSFTGQLLTYSLLNATYRSTSLVISLILTVKDKVVLYPLQEGGTFQTISE